MSSFSPSTVISATSVIALEPHRPAAMGQLALRQQVALEHHVDGLQVELLGEVEHREVLVVELAVLVGGVAVAADQLVEVALVRLLVLLRRSST